MPPGGPPRGRSPPGSVWIRFPRLASSEQGRFQGVEGFRGVPGGIEESLVHYTVFRQC